MVPYIISYHILLISLILIIFHPYTINSTKREIEITEDFVLPLEHCTEKTSSIWEKRGEIIFSKKGSTRNFKVLAEVNNYELTDSMITNIENECKIKGNYKIRFKCNGFYFYSLIKAVRFYTPFY